MQIEYLARLGYVKVSWVKMDQVRLVQVIW